MRKDDILKLDQDIKKVSDQLAEEAEEEEEGGKEGALLQQFASFSKMKGKHRKKIKELEALEEISLEVLLQRQYEGYAMRGETLTTEAEEVRIVRTKVNGNPKSQAPTRNKSGCRVMCHSSLGIHFLSTFLHLVQQLTLLFSPARYYSEPVSSGGS